MSLLRSPDAPESFYEAASAWGRIPCRGSCSGGCRDEHDGRKRETGCLLGLITVRTRSTMQVEPDAPAMPAEVGAFGCIIDLGMSSRNLPA